MSSDRGSSRNRDKDRFRGRDSPPDEVTNHADVTAEFSPNEEEREAKILRPREHERRIHDF